LFPIRLEEQHRIKNPEGRRRQFGGRNIEERSLRLLEGRQQEKKNKHRSPGRNKDPIAGRFGETTTNFVIFSDWKRKKNGNAAHERGESTTSE